MPTTSFTTMQAIQTSSFQNGCIFILNANMECGYESEGKISISVQHFKYE